MIELKGGDDKPLAFTLVFIRQNNNIVHNLNWGVVAAL